MFPSMFSTTEKNSVDNRNFEAPKPINIINDSPIGKFTTGTDESDDVFAYLLSKAIEFFSFIKTLNIEVIMIMYMFFTPLRIVSTTNLILNRVCLIHLNFTEDVCRDLASYPNQKIEVEKVSNNYLVGHNLIQALPACIVIVFISTWSDIYGRKVPLVIIIVGLALEGLSVAICAAFFKNSIWLIPITAAFTGLSGGLSSATSIAYSYISDISTTSQRTFKYALMDLVSGVSYSLGQLSGGWLYTYSGYVPAMLLSACGNLLALVTVVFVLKETRGLDSVDKWPTKFKSLFSCKSVIDGIKATLQSRPNRGRTKMFLLILGLTMTTLSYSSSTFGLLQGLGALAAHSSIAKVVSKDDVGKVFSFISSAEGLIYVMNAAVMAELFNATLNLNPGLVYFGAAGLPIIPISIFIWISRLPSDEYANLEHNIQDDGITSKLEQEQTTNVNETTCLLKHA